MRRRGLLAAVLCVAGLAAACGEGNEAEAELRQALRRTERLATSFVYQEATRDRTVEVKGLIEDDFRFQAQLGIGDRPVMEQVVSDDARAVRVLQPRRLGDLALDIEAGQAPTELDGVTVVDALASRRWVLDPVGAPPTTSTAEDLDVTGEDPVRDARLVLNYVERAMRAAWNVSVYNPDSLSYKASEDPFPTPEDGSGVRRYDLNAPWVPKPDSGEQDMPGTIHLRKLSVYVDDGIIIRVMEQVSAHGDQGERLEFWLRRAMERWNPDEAAQFERALDSMEEDERSDFLIFVLNAVLESAGQDPVRARTMRVDFVDTGEENRVRLPSEAIEGSLALFLPPQEADGETGSGVETGGSPAAASPPASASESASASASTTTSVVP